MQGMGAGRRHLSRGNGPDLFPVRKQGFRTGSLIDRMVRAAPDDRLRVGGVDDGIRLDAGEVLAYDSKWHIRSCFFYYTFAESCDMIMSVRPDNSVLSIIV